MAALKLNRISKIFVATNYVPLRFGTVVNVRRFGILARTIVGENLHKEAKYGCTAVEVKQAAAVRRLASNCTAPQIAGNNSADDDNSGSSGEENSRIRKIDIRLPWTERMPKVAFLLTNVIQGEDCQRYINITEQIGYSSENGEDNSNGSVCLWQSKEEASRLLEAIQPYIPDNWYGGTKISGLHNILRFERYKAGELSYPRRDGAHLREHNDVSYLTFLLFLNDVEVGGTSLVSPPVCDNTIGKQEAQPMHRVDIQPRVGSVLVFQNDVFFENVTVRSGTKYVLKGEVLYNKLPKGEFSNTQIVRDFFSGRTKKLSTDTSCKIIQPTTWFFPNNVLAENTKSTSKPKGVPYYMPQKKEFIYIG